MSDPETPPDERPRDAAPVTRPMGHRLLLLGGTIVAVVVAYFIASATIPRWWAQRIGDQVDGSGTAGVGLGTGSAAHAGERILDVDAPYFRGATLVGAIVGALAAVGVRYLIDSRRRHKRQEDELRDELKTRDEAERARADEAAQ